MLISRASIQSVLKIQVQVRYRELKLTPCRLPSMGLDILPKAHPPGTGSNGIKVPS